MGFQNRSQIIKRSKDGSRISFDFSFSLDIKNYALSLQIF